MKMGTRNKKGGNGDLLRGRLPSPAPTPAEPMSREDAGSRKKTAGQVGGEILEVDAPPRRDRLMKFIKDAVTQYDCEHQHHAAEDVSRRIGFPPESPEHEDSENEEDDDVNEGVIPGKNPPLEPPRRDRGGHEDA